MYVVCGGKGTIHNSILNARVRSINIPLDYYGIIGVPITFLSKYNPDQFEIIGIDKDLRKPMSKIAHPGEYNNSGTALYLPYSGNGFKYKATYRRLFIRRKGV